MFLIGKQIRRLAHALLELARVARKRRRQRLVVDGDGRRHGQRLALERAVHERLELGELGATFGWHATRRAVLERNPALRRVVANRRPLALLHQRRREIDVARQQRVAQVGALHVLFDASHERRRRRSFVGHAATAVSDQRAQERIYSRRHWRRSKIDSHALVDAVLIRVGTPRNIVGRELDDDTAKRVDVAALVDRLLTQHFGRSPIRRADHVGRLLTRDLDARDAKVGNLARHVVSEQAVLGCNN